MPKHVYLQFSARRGARAPSDGLHRLFLSTDEYLNLWKNPLRGALSLCAENERKIKVRNKFFFAFYKSVLVHGTRGLVAVVLLIFTACNWSLGLKTELKVIN